MQRRIFYAAGPSDVVTGFLSLGLFGGLVVLCFYGAAHQVYGGLGYPLMKLFPLALAGAYTMLYRERVVADPRYKTLDIKRSLFVIPLSHHRAEFHEIQSVCWKARPGLGGVQMVLVMASGQEYVLARASQPDPERSAEVRRYFELQERPADDIIPPPPPAPVAHAGQGKRVAGLVMGGIALLVLFMGVLLPSPEATGVGVALLVVGLVAIRAGYRELKKAKRAEVAGGGE